MFKYVVILALCICALAVVATPAHAQTACIGCNAQAYCQTNSVKGGCGCMQWYRSPYRYCQVCGGCLFTFCLQPCGPGQMQAMQAVPLAPLAAWVTNTEIVSAIKQHSPATGGLLEMLQMRYKTSGSCSSLHGRIANESIPTDGAEYDAIIAANGAEIAVQFDSGREERVSITRETVTFKRGGVVLHSASLR
jgi:hypothetical protein